MSQPIFKPRTFNGDLAHLPTCAVTAQAHEALGGVELGIPHQQERRREMDQAAVSNRGSQPAGEGKRCEHLGKV